MKSSDIFSGFSSRLIRRFIFWLFLAISTDGFSSTQLVRIEDSGVGNWDSISQYAPGFGSAGPIRLDWDPKNDWFTELLAWNSPSYSGQGAAFCWYSDLQCGLDLLVEEKNTTLTLDGFSLGYYGYGDYVNFDVIDLASQQSLLSDTPWVDGVAGWLVDVNFSSDVGFRILFGPDGFSGGINNISYSYQPTLVHTPLPTAVWLFGSGLIGLICFARRSNQVKDC